MLVSLLACHGCDYLLVGLGAIISRSTPTVELGTTSLFLPSIVGAVSGFNVATTVWQLYLSFFLLWLKISMWLCELVLYPASLCSLVVGCQYITKSFRNRVQLEINTIPAHIIWDRLRCLFWTMLFGL